MSPDLWEIGYWKNRHASPRLTTLVDKLNKDLIPFSFLQLKSFAILAFCLLIWGFQAQFTYAEITKSASVQKEASERQERPLWKRSFEEIKEKAEVGDAYAQAVLADRYMSGIGTYLDFEKAVYWAEKSTEQKNPLGAYVLSILLADGSGVEKNQKRMLELQKTYLGGIQTLAMEGDALALNLYGIMYCFGTVVKKNSKKALIVFEKSAAQSYADAYNNISGIYKSGKELAKNLKKAFYYNQQAANLGHVHAQYNLGIKYENGQGTERDYVKAIKWYKRAAENGQITAQSNLGFLYLHGLGTSKNYEQALYWYNKAAKKNEKKAENGLGRIYAEGLGVKQNFQTAMYWFKRAANHGNALACKNLGIMYYKGWGVRQNCDKAIDWFEKAKELGYVKADSYIKDTKLTCK